MKSSSSKYRMALLPALSLITVMTAAQIRNPVRWNFSTEKTGGNKYDLVLKATMEDGWHLYSQDIPEGGPIPTSFEFTESSAFKLIGKVRELSDAEVKFDKSFNMEVKMYNDEAVFRQEIEVLSPEDFTVDGSLEFMCCNDESCLPPRDVDFSFTVPGTAGGAKEDAAAMAKSGKVMEMPADLRKKLTPAKNSLEGRIAGDSTTKTETGPVTDEAMQEGKEAENTTAGRETDYLTGSAGNDNRSSIWVFFLVAFLGGLAGVLTPCVFPMIPMTVSFFMQGSDNRMRAIARGLVFGISVILIYTSLGFLVSLTGAGADLANQVSTHWIPNLIFFILFMIFAASFLGMFELVLPGAWTNKTDSQVDKGGYLATFFMALTLVLVSFSCTGPIVGAILVESVGGLRLKPIIGMFGFSLAFALPFTLLAIFPSWLKNLPKSGGWLNSVKVVLGFIVLAFGMKFLSTIDQTYHLGILSRDIYLAVWIVIFTLLGLYLLGKLRLAHDSPVETLSVPRLVLAIATFTFVLYLVPGLFGAKLTAIAPLIPPETSQNFSLRSAMPGAALSPAGEGDGSVTTGQCGEARYSDILHLPYGLMGYFDYEQGMECAREVGKPVLIDFKGHACSNCKEMVARVWSDPAVLSRLRNDYVIIALYNDDRTRLPEADWVTSSTGKVLRTMGRVNVEFEMQRFKTNTMPLYALVDHDGSLLAEPRGTDLDPSPGPHVDEP